MSEQHETVELLCGCQMQGGGIVTRCHEAQELMEATYSYERDLEHATWNEYSDHFDPDANPPVRKLVNHQWVTIEDAMEVQP